jgi:hypothetical protein
VEVSEGLFGRAPAMAKIASVVAPLVKQILWRSQNLFRKTFGKIDSFV